MKERIKLVILDLDGTLWDGILLEDGLDGIKPKPEMLTLINRLDASGILLSVASKSELADVRQAFAKHGLTKLFVFPQVSWEAKSNRVRRILRAVRFAPSACLFVDDTSYEREEVKSAFPDMTVVTPEAFLALADDPVLAGDHASKEGKNRKAFYQQEEVRQSEESAFEGSYRRFMMESKLKVTVGTPGPETVDRVVELVNRTNQINFSTNRYTRDQVEALLASDRHLCFVAAAEDRYGPYGTIGFACLRLEANGTGTVQDLMLSCRIQGRGVEAAIISTVADVAYRKGLARLVGLFRPTSRNGHISSVYANLGFQRNGMEGDFQRFALGLSGKRPSVPAHIQLIISDDVASLHAEGIPFVRKIVEDLVHRGALEGTILDVGAGWDGILGEDCDTWLVNSGRKHVRLDMEEYPRTDIVANAQNMPEVGDAEVASVMCLDVLEHCTNPFALSSELMRVLKPGGTAVVSAPMNYVIHNHPGDYWRFTPDGLKLLFLGNSEIVSEHVEGEEDHPVRTVLVVRKSAPACQRV